MTCRIDRVSTEQCVLLCISGRLTTEDLDILRAELADGRVSAIALAEVELVDRDAVKLLAQAVARGIELRNCPAYIREWISKEQTES